jgi:hypothetical protein
LRAIQDAQFDDFCADFFVTARKGRSRVFDNVFANLRNGDTRAFRMRYLLSKLTQAIDVRAYGNTGSHGTLATYFDGKNDIEHILPENPSIEAIAEFGETSIEPELPQRLGNLMLFEKTINQLLGNKPYSQKAKIYPQSQYLLVKCQPSRPVFGVADQITKAISTVPSFGKWTRSDIDKRQAYLAGLAREVWGVPSDTPVATTATVGG